MEKVKLKFKADLSKSEICRVYLNPDVAPLKIGGVEFPIELSAYSGLEYWFVPILTEHEVELFRENGKDISSKMKHYTEDWDHQAIPFSQAEIKNLTKDKSSLFKKADPEVVKKALFCKFPITSSRVEQSIIKLLRYCQNHLEDSNEDKILELLFKQSVQNNNKMAIGVDIFNNVSDLSLEVIFELEMEEKIDFSNLYFLCLDSDVDLFSSVSNTIPNVIVYEDTLHFGKLHLNVPSMESLETYKISMKSFVCNSDKIRQKFSRID